MTKKEFEQLCIELHGIKNKMGAQSVQLDIYNKSLQEHMSRTSLNEAALVAQREYFEYRHEAIDKRMEKQEAAFNGLPTKILQLVSILGGLIALVKMLV